MTKLIIDLSDVAGESHPEDNVVVWSPVHREGSAGRTVSPTQHTIRLTEGVGEREVEPGPLMVQTHVRAIADTRPKEVVVPDQDTVTLWDLLEQDFTYTPPVVSSVSQDRAAAEDAAGRAEAGADRVGTAEQVETWAEAAKTSETNASTAASDALIIKNSIPATVATEVDLQVPPAVSDAIAQDSTIVTAAQDAVYAEVDAGLPGKADTSYVDAQDQALGQRITDERWKRSFIPAGTLSLDDLTEGEWTIGSTSLANALGLPAARGGLTLRDVTDGRVGVFTVLAGGTRRQEVWVISKLQDTWQPWHRIYPLDDKADVTYVDRMLDKKADYSTPASTSGDAVWAQVTEDGQRLPLGYGEDGHLDDHARAVWREDTLNLRTEDDGSGYAYRLTSDKGHLLLGIEHDGRTTLPGLVTTNHPREHYLAEDGHLRPVHAGMSQWSIWGSSSLDYIAQMLVDMAPAGTRVNDEANGGERIQHVAARLGSNPVILHDPVIPASGTATVDCELYRMTNMRPFTGTVDGVDVSFAWDTSLGSWAITRTTPGEEITLTGDYPLIPTRGMAARDHMTILWAGKNNTTDEGGEQVMIDMTHDMIKFLTPLHKRVLVLGHLPNDTEAWNDESTGHLWRLRTVNAELARRYGRLFVDLEAVIFSPDIWERTGLTPTDSDLAAQAARKMPPSLTFDGAHLVEELNRVIIDVIDTRIRQLRWY